MPNVNPGPAKSTSGLSQALLSGALSTPVTVFLGAGPYDNVGTSTIPYYQSGQTSLIVLYAASGGSTIRGLDGREAQNGWTLLIQNASPTDPLIFNHLAPTSYFYNQFSNENGGQVQIVPLGAARATRVNQQWQFA